MIDESKELLFIHIARTAGTSIEVALVDRDWWNIDPPTKHISARQARKYYGEEIWDAYSKFSVVRNPWDRVASMFRVGNWHTALNLPLDCSLEHFIRHLRPHPHEQYQSLFYYDILNEELDYILRFENLQKDFDEMIDDIGLGYLDIEIRHIGSKSRFHYSEIYTDAEINLVGEIFARDIADYGYEFRPRSD